MGARWIVASGLSRCGRQVTQTHRPTRVACAFDEVESSIAFVIVCRPLRADGGIVRCMGRTTCWWPPSNGLWLAALLLNTNRRQWSHYTILLQYNNNNSLQWGYCQPEWDRRWGLHYQHALFPEWFESLDGLVVEVCFKHIVGGRTMYCFQEFFSRF